MDAVALRTMAFAHPEGLSILLRGLAAPVARFPIEVYNQDEGALPLAADDRELSELARGLRFAERQAATRPLSEARRYRTWLRNAAQLRAHLGQGGLVIDPLTIGELLLREQLRDEDGIGRGEAAGLVLALRDRAKVVFVSSDDRACVAAGRLGAGYRTLLDVVDAWVERSHPTVREIDAVINGMRHAKFGLTHEAASALRRKARR